MTLGRLLELSEDDVICDLAETYNIFDYEKLPPYKVAIFVLGLRDDSRIMLKVQDRPVSLDRIIQAIACDNLSMLVWSKSKDAQHNRNRPKKIIDALLNSPKEKPMSFASGEDFKKAWESL